jgi:hypothetical protein
MVIIEGGNKKKKRQKAIIIGHFKDENNPSKLSSVVELM